MIQVGSDIYITNNKYPYHIRFIPDYIGTPETSILTLVEDTLRYPIAGYRFVFLCGKYTIPVYHSFVVGYTLFMLVKEHTIPIIKECKGSNFSSTYAVPESVCIEEEYSKYYTSTRDNYMVPGNGYILITD